MTRLFSFFGDSGVIFGSMTLLGFIVLSTVV